MNNIFSYIYRLFYYNPLDELINFNIDGFNQDEKISFRILINSIIRIQKKEKILNLIYQIKQKNLSNDILNLLDSYIKNFDKKIDIGFNLNSYSNNTIHLSSSPVR